MILYANLVYRNDDVLICYDACRSCWSKIKKTETDFQMMNYLANRVKAGHESVLEHSNVIIEFIISKDTEEILDLMTAGKYLRIIGVPSNVMPERTYLLIGGSIRGFKEYLRNSTLQQSEVRDHIKQILCENFYSGYFIDFIEDGIFDLNDFPKCKDEHYDTRHMYHNDPLTEVVNVDPYEVVVNRLYNSNMYTTKDIYSLLTITVNFRNMSRAASHQLVRHRNGITQSSMRYIDQTGATAYVPTRERGDIKHELNILGGTFYLTYEEITKLEISIYEQLREQGSLKEDARGILPINTQTTNLYMTFTYMHFIKFLQLRTEVHAQEEIRTYAIRLFNHFVEDTNILPYDIYDYLKPVYALEQEEYMDLDDTIDEIL